MNIRKLYQRLRYWRQLRNGFGLLSDLGDKRTFVKANGRAFIMNGRDPLVRVDLSTGNAEQYSQPKANMVTHYKLKVNLPESEKQ